MGAIVAACFSQVIRASSQRRLRVDRANKAALTANMRKMLTIFNAMLKYRPPWQQVKAHHA